MPALKNFNPPAMVAVDVENMAQCRPRWDLGEEG